MSGWASCTLCAGEGRVARIDEANQCVDIVPCPACLTRDRSLYGTCFVYEGCRVPPPSVASREVRIADLLYERPDGTIDVRVPPPPG